MSQVSHYTDEKLQTKAMMDVISVHSLSRTIFLLMSTYTLFLLSYQWNMQLQRDGNKAPNSADRKIQSERSLFQKNLVKNKMHLDKVCTSHPELQNQDISSSQMLVYKEHDLLWCPVFKAGSTTFSDFFYQISSKFDDGEKRRLSESHPVLELAKMVSNKDHDVSYGYYKSKAHPYDQLMSYNKIGNDERRSLKKMIIVRNPFERLVSAFRDKLEKLHNDDINRDWYYQQYGKRIVKTHRENALKLFGGDHFNAERNFGAPIPSPRRNTSELPIFWEFVQYLKQAVWMDEHWKPIYSLCSVCAVNYDYVFKMEDLEREESFIKELISPPGSFPREQSNKRLASLSSESITKMYLKSLSDEDIRHLFEIYKYDFELFGYNFTLP